MAKSKMVKYFEVKVSDLCTMIYLASLNSGSNGNCYYIGTEHDAVFIDAGISCRETEHRMAELGLSLEKVRGIFISHEHIDHVKGAEVLSRKHKIPVYITPDTYAQSRLRIDSKLRHLFIAHEPVKLGELTINPFPKKHDGIDPHSFSVTAHGVTAGIFTDIGAPCENVVKHFRHCHAALLETNYDPDMLETGRYPLRLKRRIRGENGHLSNIQALEIFTAFRSPHLKLLMLGHLSQENNRPEIVRELFKPHANGTRIEIASRYTQSEIFTIRA